MTPNHLPAELQGGGKNKGVYIQKTLGMNLCDPRHITSPSLLFLICKLTLAGQAYFKDYK